MYEFYIVNVHTYESLAIYGYDVTDAFRRAKLNGADYQVQFADYID